MFGVDCSGFGAQLQVKETGAGRASRLLGIEERLQVRSVD